MARTILDSGGLEWLIKTSTGRWLRLEEEEEEGEAGHNKPLPWAKCFDSSNNVSTVFKLLWRFFGSKYANELCCNMRDTMELWLSPLVNDEFIPPPK